MNHANSQPSGLREYIARSAKAADCPSWKVGEMIQLEACFFKLGWFKHLAHETPFESWKLWCISNRRQHLISLIKTRTHPETFTILTWYKLKGIYFLRSVPTIRDQNQQVLWCLVCVCVLFGKFGKNTWFFGWIWMICLKQNIFGVFVKENRLAPNSQDEIIC